MPFESDAMTDLRQWGVVGVRPVSIGWLGMLAFICGVTVVVLFISGLVKRRYLWEPLWLGCLALGLGLLGTAVKLIDALSSFSALGPAGNSADLAQEAAEALIPTSIGLAVLIAGIAGSLILWLRRVPEARPVEYLDEEYPEFEEEAQGEAPD